jgi:hypothetical protein
LVGAWRHRRCRHFYRVFYTRIASFRVATFQLPCPYCLFTFLWRSAFLTTFFMTSFYSTSFLLFVASPYGNCITDFLKQLCPPFVMEW